MTKWTIFLTLTLLFVGSFYLQAAQKKGKYNEKPGMQVIAETSKPAAQVLEDIKTVASKYSFGILNIHDMGEILDENGYPIYNACYILDICNPQYVQQVLSEDINMAVALPVRIAIYQEGITKIATIKPTALLAGLNASFNLQAIAEGVEQDIVNIMEEVM